jgi:hypothetical protein
MNVILHRTNDTLESVEWYQSVAYLNDQMMFVEWYQSVAY